MRLVVLLSKEKPVWDLDPVFHIEVSKDIETTG